MASLLPEFIIRKLAGQTFHSFDHFSQAFWLAIAEDPIYSQQFIPAQLNRLKKGWPLARHSMKRQRDCARIRYAT